MAEFQAAFLIVMNHEGGYANDPDDTGGETYKGIARRFWASWDGWPMIDHIKGSRGTTAVIINRCAQENDVIQKCVLGFYKKHFWDSLCLDDVKDQNIATELFDTGVNCGVDTSAMFLQRALNVLNRNAADYPDLILDGRIGPKSIEYLNAHKRPGELYKTLNVLQGSRYISIAEKNTKQEKFFRSWLSRVNL